MIEIHDHKVEEEITMLAHNEKVFQFTTVSTAISTWKIVQKMNNVS